MDQNQLIRGVVEAIQELPAWQWLESQMAAAEAEGNRQRPYQTDTVGAAIAPQARMERQHVPTSPQHAQQQTELPEPRDGRIQFSRGFASAAWHRRTA